MKTKYALVFGLLSICMISGGVATFGQRLYPVQGPAATQTDPPLFTAKVTNYLGKSGIITLVQVNGESFRGPWSIVTATYYNDKTPGTPASYPPQPNLAFAWMQSTGGVLCFHNSRQRKRWTGSRYRR